jgi:hypothetical protein
MRAHVASQLCSLRNNNTALVKAQTRSGFFPRSRFSLHQIKRSRSACNIVVGIAQGIRSAEVKWLVFPTVTRKTRVQCPTAEFFHSRHVTCESMRPANFAPIARTTKL